MSDSETEVIEPEQVNPESVDINGELPHATEMTVDEEHSFRLDELIQQVHRKVKTNFRLAKEQLRHNRGNFETLSTLSDLLNQQTDALLSLAAAPNSLPRRQA